MDPQAGRDGFVIIVGLIVVMSLILFSGVAIEWIFGLLP